MNRLKRRRLKQNAESSTKPPLPKPTPKDTTTAGSSATISSAVKVALIGWIWAVTAIDIWCCQFLEPRYELNPLARLILVSYGVWTLIALKVFGTFLATEIMRYLPLRYVILIAIGEAALVAVLMQ